MNFDNESKSRGGGGHFWGGGLGACGAVQLWTLRKLHTAEVKHCMVLRRDTEQS